MSKIKDGKWFDDFLEACIEPESREIVNKDREKWEKDNRVFEDYISLKKDNQLYFDYLSNLLDYMGISKTKQAVESEKKVRYKVLNVEQGTNIVKELADVKPYGSLDEVIGKIFHVEDFGEEYSFDNISNCALDIEDIIIDLNYRSVHNKGYNVVFEVETWGKMVKYSRFRKAYENVKILRMVKRSELQEIIKQKSAQMDWNYYEACYPVLPFDKKAELSHGEISELLYKLVDAYVGLRYRSGKYIYAETIGGGIGGGNLIDRVLEEQVGHDMYEAVKDSVTSCVKDGIVKTINEEGYKYDSSYFDFFISAYISSFFPKVDWNKYVEVEKLRKCILWDYDDTRNSNPFSPAIELWNKGNFVIKYRNKWKVIGKGDQLVRLSENYRVRIDGREIEEGDNIIL